MPGDKGSKIDAKIRQEAAPSKAIEIIAKLKIGHSRGKEGPGTG